MSSRPDAPHTSPLPRRSYIGLDLQMHQDAKQAWLRVEEVEPGSPAALSGAESGDLLLEVAGQPCTGLAEARRLCRELAVDSPCPIIVQRNGKPIELSLTPRTVPLESLTQGNIELGEVRVGAQRLRLLWSWPTAQASRPLPTVLLLPGATWLSDEYPTEPEHPIMRLVDQLTSAGVATLRVERSGMGDSEGPLCTEVDLLGPEGELVGFQAGLAAAARHPAVDPARLFVFGRSLGGMLAPLVVGSQTVAGVAVWGTSARPWQEAMLRSIQRQLEVRGTGEAQLRRFCARAKTLHALIYEQQLSPDLAYKTRPDLADVLPGVFNEQYVHGRVARFFHQLQNAQVQQAFTKLSCPVLALHGDCDWLSELADSRDIAALRGTAGNYLELPGVDHHLHSRQSLAEASAQPWGGAYSPAAGEALLNFVLQPPSQ